MGVSESRVSVASTAVDFFASGDSQHRRRRSGLGALATILFLPALLGVMGCLELPAPVGDPEKSRIDPGMSGIWLQTVDVSGGLLWIFEPYDKRTWLIRWVEVAEKTNDDEEDFDAIPSDDADESIDDELTTLQLLQSGRLQANGVALFKGWRKRISGHSFVTMELKGMLGSETGMDSGIWWVAKANLVDANRLELNFIRKEFDEIEDEMTRSQLERVVRRNIDNPDLVSDEIFGGVFERVPRADYDIVAEMLDEAGVMSTYD